VSPAVIATGGRLYAARAAPTSSRALDRTRVAPEKACTVSGGTRIAIALLVGVAAWAVYRRATPSEGYNRSDPLLLVATSESLLREGNLELSEYADEIDPRFYGLLVLDGRPYNRYPIGASLVVLPLVWLSDGRSGGDPSLSHSLQVAATCAHVMAALAVGLMFLLLAGLARPWQALALTLVFAFATVHYPVHAGGLWTHNVATVLVLGALLALVAGDGRHAWLAAFPLGLAFVTRPTTAPMIAVLSVYVALRQPAQLARYALVGGGLGALFVGWSLYMYGSPLPPYYTEHDTTAPYYMTLPIFLEAIAGHLVSPNRGLFVFMPVLVFALWGMVRAFRTHGRHGAFHRTLTVIVVVQWLAVSVLARRWWGGWTFGPRHVLEVLPLLIVLLVPALDAAAARPARVRWAVAPLVAAALAWSLFVMVHAATSLEPHLWNSTPVSVDAHPERVWDWGDMQVLRGVLRR
jgi:hypothetical protein